MENRLPLTIDPIKAAQKRLDYVGMFLTKSANRLVASVENVNSNIECALSFGIDRQRLCVIAIDAKVSVTLVCQRCQQSFDLTGYITSRYTRI